MNRIKLSPLATTQLEATKSDDPNQSIFSPAEQASAFRRTSEGEFSLFVPMHYESSYAYPLIVWLHSDDADCNQLQKLMPQISVRNHVAIAPQSGFSLASPIAWPNCEESVEAAYESVMATVDEAKIRFNIHSGRVILAGAGTGGTMAFRIAFERPDVFGGVISIDGPMETEHVPLRDWERCRELPVLLSSFRSSDSYTSEDLCHHLRLLHIAGFTTTVRQYPGEAKLTNSVLADMDRWIMEQIGSSIL
jgi:phospholipase/carboxylesterase